MTAKTKTELAVDNLCRKAIEQNLGDLSQLPQELLTCIFSVYREFMTCYLNVLRQNENRSADWMPAAVRIDAGLTDQMRHFFSDYQHITRRFYKLNQDIHRLKAMSPCLLREWELSRPSWPEIFPTAVFAPMPGLDPSIKVRLN